MSQYFDNDRNIKSEKRNIKFYFRDREYNVISDNGIFSKDKFDYGTRLLLESMDIDNLSGKVLDLGCGIGVVGVILGTINKNIDIDMVDINERAIEISKENTKMYKINNNVFISDIYDNVKCKYDTIITNPPIRAGKIVVRKFLVDSINYLKDNGVLYFVMRKNHGVKSMIKELDAIFDVEIINKDNGFYIVKASKIKD